MYNLYGSISGNEALWDIFTRKEEYDAIKFDKHNRFAHKFSAQDNICNPVVSRALMENGLCAQFPENKKFALCLTHDIDDIYPTSLHTLYSSLYDIKRGDLQGLRTQSLWRIHGKNNSPYINFEKIIKLEEKYNAKSSFYFLTAKRDIKRFRYNIEDLESELGFIVDNDCEVGLHGGYYTYNCLDEMKDEKKRLEELLGRRILGYRNHYLRFKVPETWELLAKAGFGYDSTLGYTDAIGFRNGMCHPFFPYNLLKKEYINILEINLNIMDSTLFKTVNSFDEAWNNVKYLIDIAQKNEGVLTLLWHNSGFNCPFREHWEKIYEKILNYCNNNGAWMTSGIEIYNWWHKSMS
jgi:peptidoglycan/xylan/chitin deacetylase (PgdA/CDA1 family)